MSQNKGTLFNLQNNLFSREPWGLVIALLGFFLHCAFFKRERGFLMVLSDLILLLFRWMIHDMNETLEFNVIKAAILFHTSAILTPCLGVNFTELRET